MLLPSNNLITPSPRDKLPLLKAAGGACSTRTCTPTFHTANMPTEFMAGIFLDGNCTTRLYTLRAKTHKSTILLGTVGERGSRARNLLHRTAPAQLYVNNYTHTEHWRQDNK
jgi:hypothetical protein